MMRCAETHMHTQTLTESRAAAQSLAAAQQPSPLFRTMEAMRAWAYSW